MAGRSGSGMIMHLDKVPAREEGMSPYDFMLSESQERMLICAKKGSENRIIEIFEKWDLDVAVIGEVTDTGNMELFWQNKKVADIPIDPVSQEAPELDRPTAYPKYLDEVNSFDIQTIKRKSSQEVFEELLGDIEIADKSYIYEQYDSMVQTNTINGPGFGDASVIRIKENKKALAMSADCNTRYCYIDPKGGAMAAVMESGRNVALKGARPLAITDCLNYGNPENPEVMWQFKNGTQGIKEACWALNTPVIGGNVSLYNETKGVSVYPTPSIAMVGLMDSPDKVIPSAFTKEGNSIYLIGDTALDLGGSLYMKKLSKKVAGKMGEISLEKELKLWNLILEANDAKLIKSSKDCSVGGMAIALAKMSARSKFGCEINSGFDDDRLLFSESLSRAIVEINNNEAFGDLAQKYNINITKIGKVGGNRIKIDNINITKTKLDNIYFNSFKKIMEQDL
jgi:phosphoribosylformylglycinamidine synthase